MTSEGLRAGWNRALVGGHRAILCAVLILNFGLSLYTAVVTLRDFPNSADEYASVLSAKLMAQGSLSVPSPEPRKFFTLYNVINNGRFYGKYPPGWPALLSVGILAGMPWLLNPLIGLATMALVHRIARRFFSVQASTIALLLMAANPFLVFNSASYFSHPACLLAVVGMIYCVFACLEDPGKLWAFAGLGFAAGAGFLIRPFTLLSVALPLALYLLWRATRAGAGAGASLTRGLCLGAAIFAIFLQLFFLYNWALTGNPFLQPFGVYDPHDTLGFSGYYDDLSTRIRETIVLRGLELLPWLPAAPILVLAALFLPASTRAGARERLLVVAFLSLYAGYFFYWGPGINQYGPRYLYEGAGALIVGAAAALNRRRRAAPFLVIAALAVNVSVFVHATLIHADQVRERMAVYDLVRKQGTSQAVVFLKTGSGTMPAADLVRNGVRFNASVLYVHDFGAENSSLLTSFPGRKAYRFEYSQARRAGTLTPMPTAEGGGR